MGSKQDHSFTLMNVWSGIETHALGFRRAGEHRLGRDGNQLAEMAMSIAGKKLRIKHVPGPLGVRGRNSDNRLIKEKLNWAPSKKLREGLEKTYFWIQEQVSKAVVAV